MQPDVVVLGAGMVGLGSALALQELGASVAIVDRRGPAAEASFGNAGLIQSEAVIPYAFPRDLRTIVGVLLDRRTDARVHLPGLPGLAGRLLAYAAAGGAEAIDRTARANVPILARVVAEHRRLAHEAGAMGLWREGGYLRLFRTAAALDAARAGAETANARYGVPFEVLDGERLAREEPHLKPGLSGAIRHAAPVRIEDPGALGKAYAALFEKRGGTVLRGNAETLRRAERRFAVSTDEGEVSAEACVIALGAWSATVLARFGSTVPLFVKRGYHMHFRPSGNAVLNNLMAVEGSGYVVGPNVRGFRLTTGAEFAPVDAPHTPVQVERASRDAADIFPLGERLDDAAWRGARPCLPDLLPVIGPVPNVQGLWCNFGHHHLGFTMGPATGRLLGEMMMAQTPFTDPAPYAVGRFNR